MAGRPPELVFGNLVLGAQGDAWAVFAVRTRSYRSAPRKAKEKLCGELEAFCRYVEADTQLLRVSRRWDLGGYLQALEAHAPRHSHRELWLGYLDAHRERLAAQEPATPLVFVCVRLAAPSMDVTARASRLFERSPQQWWRALRGALALRAPDALDPQRLADLHDRGLLAEQRVLDWLDARPARVDELEWLIRRAYTRGIGEPTVAGLSEPQALSYQPGAYPRVLAREAALLRWTAGTVVHRHSRYLHVESELGVGFQSGLCVGQLDHAEALSAAAELLFTPLESVPFAVDACLNLKFVPNDQAVRMATAQIARTGNEAEEEDKSAFGATDHAIDRIGLARELHSRLRQTDEPLLRGTFSLAFGAGSLTELDRRRNLLRAAFACDLHQPLGDQLELFMQHFPGQPALTVGFDQAFTPEQLGAMAAHATHEIGAKSPTGLYLGYTQSGHQPVLLDLREASDSDTSPTIALLGSQCGGKTTASLLLLWQAFLQGARIVDIDPKGDHRFHRLPEVARHTRAITLSPNPEFAGMLDPLRIAPADERIEAACAFMIDVLPQPVAVEHQAAITDATKRVLRRLGDRACCLEVIAELDRGSEPEQAVGRLLGTYCDLGLAQLGFADIEQPLPSASEEQVTYLQIRALPRAQPGTPRSELSPDERIGRGVLRLIALYAMRILGEERGRLKVMNFDEAHFLYEDSVGRRLMSTISRWGRAELAVPIFSTQLIADIENAENLIGHWLFFGMRSREEAGEALRLAQLDPDDERLRDALTRYERGRCLYRDLRGRTEEIQIDLVVPELSDGISTTPEREPAGAPDA